LRHKGSLVDIKIGDFGLADVYVSTATQQTTFDGVGTPYILPPEVFDAAWTRAMGSEFDVWALGVCLFACLCGRLPFGGPSLHTCLPYAATKALIVAGEVVVDEEVASSSARDLVTRMLCPDPAARLRVTDIVAHPWVNHESTSPVRKTTTLPSSTTPDSLDDALTVTTTDRHDGFTVAERMTMPHSAVLVDELDKSMGSLAALRQATTPSPLTTYDTLDAEMVQRRSEHGTAARLVGRLKLQVRAKPIDEEEKEEEGDGTDVDSSGAASVPSRRRLSAPVVAPDRFAVLSSGDRRHSVTGLPRNRSHGEKLYAAGVALTVRTHGDGERKRPSGGAVIPRSRSHGDSLANLE